MKKNIINLCLVGSLLFFGVISCKKSNDAVGKSRTELLTQAAWKLVKDETKTGTGPWIDQTPFYSPCEKDDNFVIKLNGTYELNEGATKCSPTDPQIYETGAWVFLNNEAQIKTTSTGSSSSDTVSIDQLDENTLITSSSEVISGVTYYYRTTLGH